MVYNVLIACRLATSGNLNMSQIEAVFEHGVFRPLEPIALPENQRVQLEFEVIKPNDMLVWLEQARQNRQEIMDRCGVLPDSTPDIAEDRMRDRQLLGENLS